MKLTNEEIGYAKFFLHKKKHFYFEVQVEMMDHFFAVLAVEKTKHPSILFDDLVEQTYAKCNKELNSIQSSLQKRLKAKYNLVFLGELIKPIGNRYFLILSLVGLMMFYLQAILDNHITLQCLYIVIGLLNLIVLIRYMAPSNKLTGNYLTEKTSGRYITIACVYLYCCYLFINYASKITTSSGFNINYLVIAIAVVFNLMLINAMIKTKNVGVDECLKMENFSEILNA